MPFEYPLCRNDLSYYLVSRIGSLYDTEALLAGESEVNFFVNPVAMIGKSGKTTSETNMNQSAMLDYPREFLVQEIVLSISNDWKDLSPGKVVFSHQRAVSSLETTIEYPLERLSNNDYMDGAGVISTGRNVSVRIVPGDKFGLIVKLPFKVERDFEIRASLEGVVSEP